MFNKLNSHFFFFVTNLFFMHNNEHCFRCCTTSCISNNDTGNLNNKITIERVLIYYLLHYTSRISLLCDLEGRNECSSKISISSSSVTGSCSSSGSKIIKIMIKKWK